MIEWRVKRMNKLFTITDAYNNIEGLEHARALRWAKIANETYKKYVTTGNPEQASIRKAIQKANEFIKGLNNGINS